MYHYKQRKNNKTHDNTFLMHVWFKVRVILLSFGVETCRRRLQKLKKETES